MNVLHIIKSLGRGGAEMLLPETIRLHDREAFQFHVIYFLPWKNQMVGAIERNGGKVVCFPASNNIQLLLQFRRVIRYVKEQKIDLIHCHLPWAGFLGRLVHRITGVPVLYTEHNKQERYHWLTKTINRFTFNRQSAAIAVSREVATSIQNNINPRVPVYTILNGVNTQSCQKHSDAGRRLRSEYGISDQTVVIGTIAVFRFQKRLDLWLEVFAALKQRFPGLKGVIVGAGPLNDSIMAKRSALSLENDVLMPGLQTNTVEWLSAMDVYMMSSVFEGLPIALLEAMSCGLPVVCTNAGGTGEVMRDGVDGALVPVDEPMKMVDQIAALIEDPTLRQRMGVASRKRVEEAFSMERMVGELEGLYREVVGGYDHKEFEYN